MRWDAILTRFVTGEDSVMRKTICAGLFGVLFAPVMAAAQADAAKLAPVRRARENTTQRLNRPSRKVITGAIAKE